MKNILFLFFFIAISMDSKPDSDSLQQNFIVKGQKEEIKQRKFNEAKWKQLVEDIDYSDERKFNKSSDAKTPHWKLFNFNLNPAVAKFIIFTLVISALAFLLYRIFGKNIFKRNPGVKAEDLFSEEIINAETPADGLEKLLHEAISGKLYRQAIRIYFLIVIRGLSDQKLILWKKDKTNREYLFEMRSHAAFPLLREVTYIFEAAWYRNVKISDGDFISVQPKFETLIQSVTVKANEQ